jgi:hypothetical protein
MLNASKVNLTRVEFSFIRNYEKGSFLD